MMALAAYTVPMSFGLHLFAEISDQPSEIVEHGRRQLRSGILLAAVATIGLVALGPLVLSILGPAYASHGTTAIRLAALAAVPLVVMKCYLFTCRATGRIREGTIAALLSGVTAVGLAVVAASSLGLAGMAGGWLIAQLVSALGAAFRLRTLLSRAHAASEAASTPRAAAEQMVAR
jgi:O-antigen/teichoic acid export membrane protein